MSNPYKDAGVNVESGYRISKFVKKNIDGNGSNNIGNFGGMYEIPQGYRNPVLISSNDGVGTKLLLTIQNCKLDTIGIDCVAMCVNDIIAQGARPLYFLDYISTGKVDGKVEEILKGVIAGCDLAGIDLIGGETAEMPDVYSETSYDIAGFSVGIAEKSAVLNQENVEEGDVLIGISSSGLHSNGYSLVRKILFKDNKFDMDTKLPELKHGSLGDYLLEPTRIYAKDILPLLDKKLVHGISHITGGGFFENIPRMLPDKLTARIDTRKWKQPEIFDALCKYGKLAPLDMYHIFNMGLGMVIAVSPDQEQEVLSILNRDKSQAYRIGDVINRIKNPIELLGVNK
ncbi:phosphoribosylformylglycinamidine cyclo-ligase [Companilactobacillus allii]|uniref:Phosphoribosylformylglycinamidine cyclo-ligase n=1 Tax=Companilactobacillus allii TaxID=1847728 RepID=A0A1P8Q441_9LACO|nr:phosphoribosylformylglycinamidine cyclo-ligase [Companilactobacillus allii]APX72616.1 phosphoribosylformylglycinamidine cyclo-ligase [Companilactobacillus allii]USQ69720.1 phosphoribosylformylglycinamidine cyclo-ligase [Companilactobacillus allii]